MLIWLSVAAPAVARRGGQADRSLDGLKAWRDALETAAAEPNIALKISGLGQRHRSWPRDAIARSCATPLAIFGVARCMFASNYPVDGLCVGYRALFDDFKRFVADRPPAERQALFNAVRIYRIA